MSPANSALFAALQAMASANVVADPRNIARTALVEACADNRGNGAVRVAQNARTMTTGISTRQYASLRRSQRETRSARVERPTGPRSQHDPTMSGISMIARTFV